MQNETWSSVRQQFSWCPRRDAEHRGWIDTPLSESIRREGRPLSLCKLPAHLHVKPIDQNTGNRMFGIKVSHIKKWMKVRQKERKGESRRKRLLCLAPCEVWLSWLVCAWFWCVQIKAGLVILSWSQRAVHYTEPKPLAGCRRTHGAVQNCLSHSWLALI